jgi:hypothetical protein
MMTTLDLHFCHRVSAALPGAARRAKRRSRLLRALIASREVGGAMPDYVMHATSSTIRSRSSARFE